MKEIKSYKCEFCSKLYQRKSFCERHENICCKNPKNRIVCNGCIHYQEFTKEQYGYSLASCNKQKCFLTTARKLQQNPEWFKTDYEGEIIKQYPCVCKDYELNKSSSQPVSLDMLDRFLKDRKGEKC